MPLQLFEARHRATLATDIHTRVHLDLTSVEDFGVDATISFACLRPGEETFLELVGGTDVTLDGRPAPYLDGRIALRGLGATNEVRVSARMRYVSDGDGMTVTIDPADGERYVCAFTGMDIAQKIIPCFDQPDIKSSFEVSVTAPEPRRGYRETHRTTHEGYRRVFFTKTLVPDTRQPSRQGCPPAS